MALLDENTAILVQLKANGSNLSSPRPIDFSHRFSTLEAANSFAAAAKAEGFRVAVDLSHTSEAAWDVTASKILVPLANVITEAEARLSSIAELHQGCADGWGFYDD